MTTRISTALAATALGTALVLSGCSSSSTTSTSTTTSPAGGTASSTPAVSTSSSPAGASTPATGSASGSAQPSAAAQKYLALTAPIDADLQSFLQLPNATPAARVKAAAAKVAADESTLVTELGKTSWPAAVQPTITELVKTVTAERAVYAKCAAAPDVTAIKAVLTQNKATIAARVAAAAHVRAALGLPNPGTTPAGPATASQPA